LYEVSALRQLSFTIPPEAKQWQTINVHMETNRQDLTARKLRLNESTVSRNLRRGFWWQIQETRQAMERVIEAYFP
jgi:hypothetical protein